MDYEKLVIQVYPNAYILDCAPLWKVLTGENDNKLIGWHAGYDATWHDAWQAIEKEKQLLTTETI